MGNVIKQLNKQRSQLRELAAKAAALEVLDSLTTAQRSELFSLWSKIDALEEDERVTRLKISHRVCSTKELQTEMTRAANTLKPQGTLAATLAFGFLLYLEEQLRCSLNRDQSRWRIGDKVRVTPHVDDPGGQTGYVTGFDGGNPADGYEVEIDHFEMVPEGRLELIRRPT